METESMTTPITTEEPELKDINSIIKALEKERSSKVIVYFTGEKAPNFQTQVASDVLPLLKNIVEKMGVVNKITLAINTSGGHLETPWPFVNLIREYCKNFEVIVMERSLSAGTLICLGADKIVMLPYSQLSPVDPAANITDSNKNVKHLEIEDIVGYTEFIKEKMGITEQGALAEAMKELTKEISPTVLGSVNRTHSLIRRIAINLLNLQKDKLPERQKKEIVEHLTQKLFSHRHLINRREAKMVVGFDDLIEYAKPSTKSIVDNLFNKFIELMEINKDFNPLTILGQESETNIELIRAVVYSADLQYDFKSAYNISKRPDPTGKLQLYVNNVTNQWSQKQ